MNRVSTPVPNAQHVISTLPWKWSVQGAIFIVGGLGFMFDAWDVALNGFLIPLLAREWGIGIGQAAWIATANLIGMAIGAFMWGGIADRVGRKKAFTLTLLVFSVFTVLGAFAPNMVLFAVARFVAGFGLGGCIPVDYALVGEFTPAKHRGRVLTAMDGWWPLGATLCASVSAWLVTFASWHTIMLVMVLPALLIVGVRLFIPESPMYLLAHGRTEEADAIITRLVRRTGANVTQWNHSGIEQTPTTAPLWDRIRATVGQVNLLWQYSWKITLTAWSLFVSVLLLYYAALTWLPGILKAQGLTDQAAFITTGGMTAVGVLGVVFSAILVDIVGRKWVLGASALLASASLVWFAVELGKSTGSATLSPAAIVAIVLFGFLIQLSVPALYTYVTELYPTRLRSSGFGWASAASRVAIGVAPLVFGSILWPQLGLVVTFVLTGALVAAAVVIMVILGRETKGEDLG